MERENVPAQVREGLRWLTFWTGFWGVFTVFDLWRNSKKDGSTFSQTLRNLFSTDTSKGRIIFLLVLNTLNTIFAIHILKE